MLYLVENLHNYSPEVLAVTTDVRVDNEVERLAAVTRYEILDTAPEGIFDRITALAAELFHVPISIISIVDHDRIWFKSHHGLTATEIRREPANHASVMSTIAPWILIDAESGIRSLTNPLASDTLGLGFYIGVPLRTPDGHTLGTLCVIDREPKTIDEQQIAHLKKLAAIAMDHMEVRLAALRAAAQSKVMASEIDHRVMNSLQFVSGLLNMQSRAAPSTETADQLTIAANRVSAVARVHRHFSADEAADRVPFLAYLRRVCDELAGILGAEIDVDGIEATVPATQILALGLVANELVTNAKKHGGGRIKVTFTTLAAAQFEICVADEGKGLPEGFTLDRGSNGSGGLGMKVVSALVSQLKGKLTAVANPAGRGTCFIVTFPST